MNFNQIKNFIKQNGDKFVFIENGEPEVVMMSYREYEKLMNPPAPVYKNEGRRRQFAVSAAADFSDEIPETEIVLPAEHGSSGLPIRPEDIRLEDLPI